MNEEITKNPIKYLKTLNKEQIVKILEEADKKYTNSAEPLFSDEIYDIITNYLKKIDPKNKYFDKVGANPERNKEILPYYLGSQDKKKEEKDINNWIKKYNNPKDYIISEKLDGISCLVVYNNNEINIYTRGDGSEGQNINHIKSIIPPIKGINLAVRGELLISKKNWEIIKDIGSNARNVVAGAINSKIINPNILKYIDFIVYEILSSKNQDLDCLKLMGFKVVKHIKQNEINIEKLSEILQNFKENSDYEIDGIVVRHNKEYELVKGKNPKYSFAFKSILTNESAEVIVENVEWNISKDGYLKPIVKFDEVLLNGVKIKQATGFNANFIVSNKIGPGSKIVIIRSGDVIPFIHKILTSSANNKPSMPDDIKYKWNETNVDIILDDNKKNREQDISSFLYFMKTLKIPNVAEGVITKIYDNGFDTLKKIINIKKEELLKIEGFKELSSNKILDSLKLINNKDCCSLMHASNTIGRNYGEARIKLIYDKYSFIFSDRKKALNLKIDDLIKVEGISNIMAKQFIDNLPNFYKFYDDLNIKCKNEDDKKISKEIDQKFKDKVFVFSGFRDNELEKIIKELGGTISNSITKKTYALIIKDIDETSGKITTAKEKDIQIILLEDFIKMI
jgi:NAD-dependent DNA ligase